MRTKLLIVALVLGVAFGFKIFINQNEPNNHAPEQTEKDERSFAQKMADRFYELNLPNLKKIDEPPAILGDQAADAHIIKLAAARGYRLQSLPTVQLVDVQGVSMQPVVVEYWKDLQAAAQNEGIYLGLVSAYRSPDTQQLIFTTQLRDQAIAKHGRAYGVNEIANGEADKLLQELLGAYSIPGYSKHHTGYALDITDTASKQPFEKFGKTVGYEWVSASNYANIRKFGFLPSYPEGAKNQGPLPEPWEYVWVGEEAAKDIN